MPAEAPVWTMPEIDKGDLVIFSNAATPSEEGDVIALVLSVGSRAVDLARVYPEGIVPAMGVRHASDPEPGQGYTGGFWRHRPKDQALRRALSQMGQAAPKPPTK